MIIYRIFEELWHALLQTSCRYVLSPVCLPLVPTYYPLIPSSTVPSWRSTLSSYTMTNPRVSLPGLHCDLTFCLLTYAFALSNMSSSVIVSLGTYECERHITDAERKAKDERLNFGVTLLCRASGVFTYIAEYVLPGWTQVAGPVKGKPADITQEVIIAISKCVRRIPPRTARPTTDYIRKTITSRRPAPRDPKTTHKISIRLNAHARASPPKITPLPRAHRKTIPRISVFIFLRSKPR